jgi:N-acetyl sugar amidotransferase
MSTVTSVHDRICAKCVMDESDPYIQFDNGICNHCREAEVLLERIRLTPEISDCKLHALADDIRRKAAGRPYDAVVGMSGGVDSSYAAWLSHKLGLRVLAVHFDNGWNAEIATANIHAVIDKCGFDLQTYVIDWPEFRDLQRSFIKAGVTDIEMLSDHAIVAAMFDIAARHRVPYVISGTNIATEFGMPRAWTWNKQDWTNIKAIHKAFGSRPLKSFPHMGLLKTIWRRYLSSKLEFVEILDLANFRKDAAMATLVQNTGWRYYGGKHYESTFTKFYQAHILPTKFGIDKRKPHLSALIRNREITRDEALKELDEELYDPDQLRRDKAFVLKKLGFSESEFDQIMTSSPVPHDRYATDRLVRRAIKSAAALFTARKI